MVHKTTDQISCTRSRIGATPNAHKRWNLALFTGGLAEKKLGTNGVAQRFSAHFATEKAPIPGSAVLSSIYKGSESVGVNPSLNLFEIWKYFG